MLTLDEAVAKYLVARGAVNDGNTRVALDAAFCNVAQVSARLAWNCNCDSAFAELNAKILRLFGPEKAGV